MTDRLVRKIQSLIEGVFSIVFTRSAVGSVVITKKNFRREAWFSYNIQFQSLIEDHEIDLVIDVGANEGQFAKQIRKYYRGDIYSFEPIKSVFDKLSNTAKLDDQWHVFNCALGSSDDELEINVSEMTVFSSLHESNSYSQGIFGDRSKNTKRELIKVRRLEDVLMEIIGNNMGKRIFLKLDTQGHDLEVFKGLGSFEQSVFVLQSELSIIPIYENIPHWTKSINEYETAGFTVVGMFPIVRDSLKVVEYDCLMTRK